MSYVEFHSKLLEDAVNEFSKLPGIGKKTALRLVLYLLRQEEDEVSKFGNSIINLRKEIKFCKICNSISDKDICTICANPNRNNKVVCVVENIRDVIAIENTNQYTGRYHVLGGIISPMDGIGPGDLNIKSLLEKVEKGKIEEVIFALSTTMEGDTTNYYIYKKIRNYNISITTLARGVAFGDDLEFTDEVTLGRSILNRTKFEEINKI